MEEQLRLLGSGGVGLVIASRGMHARSSRTRSWWPGEIELVLWASLIWLVGWDGSMVLDGVLSSRDARE